MSRFGGPAPRCDATVLLGLQGLVTLLPLAEGAPEMWAQGGAAFLAMSLCGLWIYKAAQLKEAGTDRARLAPVGLLLAFSVLVIVQTVPLPPSVLAVLSPHAHALFSELLPGWPDAGGWSAWRPLSLEPLLAQAGLLRYVPSFAAFAIVACYPWGQGWRDGDAARLVFGRLVATLVASATIVAAAALLQQWVSNGSLLWIFADPFAADRNPGRVHGPYVNPNHLAGYLEMVMPLSVLHLISLGRGGLNRFLYGAEATRYAAMSPRRTPAAAIAGAQRRLVAPLVTLAALSVMLSAHYGTGSRDGRIALGAAALLCVLGLLRRRMASSSLGHVVRAGAAIAGVCLLALAFAVPLLTRTPEAATTERFLDPTPRTRLIVVSQASPLLREFAVFGAGLGSWVHAFRLHQQPPIEGALWKQAHNDYLQFGVETGLMGGILLVGFAWMVMRAARRPSLCATAENGGVPPPAVPGHEDSWRTACEDRDLLRIGLAAGAGACLVRCFLDSNLQLAANALVFMMLLGLQMLSVGSRAAVPHRIGYIPALLIAVIAFGAAGSIFGFAPFSVGGGVSAAAQVDHAHASLAVEGESGRQEALRLAQGAVELAPLEPDIHEAMTHLVADAAAAEAAYRHAIRLSPDGSRLRDELALRLWQRGAQALALGEFEESIADQPRLVAHLYLTPGSNLGPSTSQDGVHALAARESLAARLGGLDPAIRDAIERGLRRALAERDVAERDGIVDDLATLLETGDRYAEAAVFLEDWNESALGDQRHVQRAASNYLKAGDFAAAERMLTQQLDLAPSNAELYRLLAVDVYAAQDDFDTADAILRAGQRNSGDLLPIYQGMREVLTRRQYRVIRGLPQQTTATSAPPVSLGGAIAAREARP